MSPVFLKLTNLVQLQPIITPAKKSSFGSSAKSAIMLDPLITQIGST